MHSENETSQLFKKNFALLKTHHQHAAEQIDKVSGLDMEIRLSEYGIPNLYIKNKNGMFSPCYNEHDPLSDINDIVDAVKGRKGVANCILGAGLCIHFNSMIDQINSDYFLILFEAQPEILKKAMHVIDFSSLFLHPLIKIAIGDGVDIQGIFGSEDAKLQSARGYNFIEFDSLISLAPAWYEDIKNKINQFFIKREESAKVMEHAGEVLFSNRFKNLFALNESRPVSDLKDRHKMIPAIIVASGPSLENNIEKIKDAKYAVIIAVDSAVAPLKLRGINPDYIVTADFRGLTYDKLSPFSDDLTESRLVFFAEATPKIPAFIGFLEKFYIFLNSACSELFSSLLNTRIKSIPDAQSVLHGAINIAQIMGCSPVVFTGVDLAFSYGKDHAEGTVLNWGNNQKTDDDSFMVESVDGTFIPSMPGFIAQREICEQLIENGPTIKYIDASEGGAKIKGTEIFTLSDVISRYCIKAGKPDCVGQRKTVNPLSAFRLSDNLRQLKKEITGVKETLDNYFRYLDKLNKDLEKNNRIQAISELPEKVKKSIHKMDSINKSLNKHKLIKSLKELLGKSYTEYLKYTFDESDIAGLSKIMKQLFLDIKQQSFVQEIRLEAVMYLSELVDEQINIYSGIDQIQVDDTRTVSEKRLILGRYYYEQYFLTKAEGVFLESKGTHEADFYLGCIYYLKDQYKNGKICFDNLLKQSTFYKEKIDAFINELTSGYINKKTPDELSRQEVERILNIDPNNHQAFELLQKKNLNEARELLITKEFTRAEIVLSASWHPDFNYDCKSMPLLLLLYFRSGKFDKMAEILSASFQLKDSEKELKKWWHYNIKETECFSPEWFPHNLVGELENWVLSDIENLRYVQMIMGNLWHETVRQLLTFNKNREFLITVEENLKHWSVLKELLPDWYFVKSLHSRNSEDFLPALSEINLALEVEKNSLESYNGAGHLLHIRAMIYTETGHYNEMLVSTQKSLEKRMMVHVWIFYNIILLINSEYDEVEKNIKNINDIPVHKDCLPHLKRLKDINNEINLYLLLIEITRACKNAAKALRIVDAFCYIDSEMHEEYAVSVKNIIFDGHIELCKDKTPALVELINKIWVEDVKRIKDGIEEEPEKLLNNWKYLSEFLQDQELVSAEYFIKMNNNKEALRILDSSIEKNLKNIDYLRLYTLQLFLTGRSAEAVDVFNQLTKLSPESVTLLKDVAENFFAAGDYASALTVYEECLVLMPENLDILFGIGKTCYQTSNYDAAIFAVETLLLKKPDHIPAKNLLQEIKISQSREI